MSVLNRLVFEAMGLVSVFGFVGFIKNIPLFDDSLGLCGVSLEGDTSVIRFALGSEFSL